MSTAWPPLPYEGWTPTKETLHRYTQLVGKIRMALTPPLNHWWHVTLRVSTRGLTTGPMPHGDGYVEIAFDLIDHRMRITTSDGREHGFDLTRRPACADFTAQLFACLDELGLSVSIQPEPFDLGDSPPFAEDRIHNSYDPDPVGRFWQVLGDTERTSARFAGRFNGKASPVQLFWHGFDLAHARFSGRPAPVDPDADPVTVEAYSHEVIAFGFWPGDARRTPFPAFYSYTAPEPEGLADRPLSAGAEWQDTGNGHLAVLAYDDVRAADDPGDALIAFYESAYRAGAGAAGWDLEAFATGR